VVDPGRGGPRCRAYEGQWTARWNPRSAKLPVLSVVALNTPKGTPNRAATLICPDGVNRIDRRLIHRSADLFNSSQELGGLQPLSF
jgi:hypothetical protein